MELDLIAWARAAQSSLTCALRALELVRNEREATIAILRHVAGFALEANVFPPGQPVSDHAHLLARLQPFRPGSGHASRRPAPPLSDARCVSAILV